MNNDRNGLTIEIVVIIILTVVFCHYCHGL